MSNAVAAARGGRLIKLDGKEAGTVSNGESGSVAVLLLNNGGSPEPAPVRCNAACVAAMVLPPSFPPTAYARDLVAHAPLPPIASVRDGFALPVPGGGASMLIKLCATAEECAGPVA